VPSPMGGIDGEDYEQMCQNNGSPDPKSKIQSRAISHDPGRNDPPRDPATYMGAI